MSTGTIAGTTALDWDRIAIWSADVAHGYSDRIHAAFKELEAAPPVIELDVSGAQLPTRLAFLYQHWLGISGTDIPRARDLDPMKLRPALGYVNLMDIVDEGRDFRYRLFGSDVARMSEFDLTGKLLSEFPARPHVAEFLIAVDRAVWASRRPVYSVRMPSGADQVMEWHRLTLPLFDEASRVSRLMVGVVPRTRRELRTINE